MSQSAQQSCWILLDTRDPDDLPILAKSPHISKGGSLVQTVKNAYSQAIATEVVEKMTAAVAQLREVVKSGTVIEHRIESALSSGKGDLRMALAPVVGPTRSLDALHVWLGNGSFTTLETPLAVSFTWDAHKRIGELLPPSAGFPGHPDVASWRSTFTSPDFHRYLRVQDMLGVVEAMVAPEYSDTAWVGSATVRDTALPLTVNVSMVVDEGNGQGYWRGLVHALTDVVEPVPVASPLELAALDALARVSERHVVLLDISKMRLIDWVTDPVPGIQWKGRVDQRDTPHPDDVVRIFEMAGEVLTGKTDRGTVESIRLRRRGGGWTVVNATGAVIKSGGPKLAMIEFEVVGYSDEPDPVPPTDEGHPGL